MTLGPACHGIWQAPRPFAFRVPPCFSFFSLGADRLPISLVWPIQRAIPSSIRLRPPVSPCRILSTVSRRLVLPWKSRVPRVSRDRLRCTWRKRRTGYVKATKNTKFNRYTQWLTLVSLLFPFSPIFCPSFPAKISFEQLKVKFAGV